jgi:hypothetical protein
VDSLLRLEVRSQRLEVDSLLRLEVRSQRLEVDACSGWR